MQIAVIGATGVVGRNLVPLLVARGHEARAIVRDTGRARDSLPSNADIAVADLFDADALARAVEGCEIVVNAASAVPRPGSSSAWDTNTRIRTEGTRCVIAAARRAGVRQVVHQSVAMVHQSPDGTPVDETAPLVDHPQTRSAIELEAIATEGEVDWQIVRGGLFYGPGTGREEHYRAAARDGSLHLPGDGTDFLSLIRIEDMAAAIATIVESGRSREAWLAVDDRPLTWRDFLGCICAREGVGEPGPGGASFLPSFAASNAKLRAAGWAPRYPTLDDGLA